MKILLVGHLSYNCKNLNFSWKLTLLHIKPWTWYMILKNCWLCWNFAISSLIITSHHGKMRILNFILTFLQLIFWRILIIIAIKNVDVGSADVGQVGTCLQAFRIGERTNIISQMKKMNLRSTSVFAFTNRTYRQHWSGYFSWKIS